MTTTTDTQTRRPHSRGARCFLCATDEEISVAMTRSAVRSLFARFTRRHPAIHWQAAACPFEETDQ